MTEYLLTVTFQVRVRADDEKHAVAMLPTIHSPYDPVRQQNGSPAEVTHVQVRPV